MTLILDMTTGEEYQGEEMSCPRATISAPAEVDRLQEPAQHLQLQLATIEVAPSQQKRCFDMAGVDIEALIQSIKD